MSKRILLPNVRQNFFNMFTEKSPTSKQRVGGRGSFRKHVVSLRFIKYHWMKH
jgi:hypothetical protein